MKLSFIRSRLFCKHLLSYAIALFVPLIILSYVVNSSIISILKHDIITANINNMNEVSERIENEIKNLRTVSSNITSNPKLTPYSFKNQGYSKNEAIQELGKYQVTGNFVKDIFYYLENDDNTYSSSGVYEIDWLLKNKYINQDWNFNEIYPLLEKTEGPLLKSITGYNKDKSPLQSYIVYLYPIKDFKGDRVLIFLIEGKVIAAMMSDILKEYNQNMILLNRNNEIILSLQNQELVAEKQFEDMVSAMEAGGSGIFGFNNEKYLISKIKSDYTGWIYVSLVNYNKIMDKVFSVQKKMITVVLLLFVIGAAFIISASYINYNPIRKLFAKLESKSNETSESGNELMFIENVVDRVFEVNSRLTQQIESNKPILGQHLLKELIKGKFNKYSELMQVGNEVGLLFQGRIYYIVIVKLLHSTQETDRDLIFQNIYELLENQENSKMKTYKIDSLHNANLAFIASMDDYEKEYINYIMKNVHERLKSEWSVSSVIGIGPPTEDILMIGNSYIKAVQALEMNFVKEWTHIIFWEELDDEIKAIQPIGWYVNAESKRLAVEIRNGNAEGVKQIIQHLIDAIVTDSVPIFLARCLIYDIVNTIMKILIELKVDFQVIKENYLDIFIYKDFESINDLQESLERASESICELISGNGYCEDELINKIFRFISENYTDMDFSLNKLSDYTGVSVPYLSNYFKEHTGCTISAYLWDMRLEKAKQLLRLTEENVINIVKMVGYIDPPNFTRKFRKTVGVTPGEYRGKFR